MNAQIRAAIVCSVLAMTVAGCTGGEPVVGAEGGTATPSGYWEGDGTARENLMNDAARKLTRSAEFEFWFTIDEDGNAAGEIEIKYDAELIVIGLPNVTIPAPGGASVTFAPKVGGKMTDLDPTRTFPLIGVISGDTLTLAIATPEDKREKLEFTIRADAGVSGGMGLGDGGVSASGGDAQLSVIEIDMTPFTPFTNPTLIEKRLGGPYATKFEDKGKDYAVEWSARQIGGAVREALEMTPEMERELRRLREQLGLD